MFYRAIGLMSGSSLDGLDVVFAEFEAQAGQWKYKILHAECFPYSAEWLNKLQRSITMPALDYARLHTAYGHYLAEAVNTFIEKHSLQHQVQFIGSHGHTSFHEPQHKTTCQLGDGAAIAAGTGIHTITDLRAMDVALGGQGAPIVPIGEQLLLSDYKLFLNLGGIANLSAHTANGYTAFDVAPANRVLNLICERIGLKYDEGGMLAAKGHLRDEVLAALNALPYYQQPHPKSLANQFGTDVVYPILEKANLSAHDALRTMVEHIAIQVGRSAGKLRNSLAADGQNTLLVTGGGAHNSFLVERIQQHLAIQKIEVVVPGTDLVDYKEALIMALHAVLRWRQEDTVLASVTGASQNSVGGALWCAPGS